MTEPLELFISYAQEDQAFREALEKHLAQLRRQGLVDVWHQRRIVAGTERKTAIDAHLEAADIILLLVSPDFLASNYLCDVEMERALARHETGEAVVIPILVRPCDWKGAPFDGLQPLPRNREPIKKWPDADEAWTEIAKGIREVVEELGKRSPTRRRMPVESQELVFELHPEQGTWRILGPTPQSPAHNAPDPFDDTDFLAQLAAFREQASRALHLDHPDAAAEESVLRALAKRIGARLSDILLSAHGREALCARLHQLDRGRARLVLRVSGNDEASDRALALPWELLMPEPGEHAVETAKLDIVREAVVPGAPTLEPPSEALSLLVSIAAPEIPGSRGLSYEDEAFRLYQALVPVGHRVIFTELGTREDLGKLAERIEPMAIHFSGHGLPGKLVFEDDFGFAKPESIEELVEDLRRRLVRSGKPARLPKLFFLASCHGASADPTPSHASRSDECRDRASAEERHGAALAGAVGRGPSTAATLHRNGFVQVVGYFGPICDPLSTRAEEAFYRALGKGKSTLQAVAEARATLREEIKLGDEHLHFPLAWAQMALFHRGPDHPLALAGSGAEYLSAPLGRDVIQVSGLPVLEHGFIGRRALQQRVRRKVRDGQRLIVLQGLGGLGKTALASQLVRRVFAKKDEDLLILTCAGVDPNREDPASHLWKQVEEHGRVHGLAGWDEQCRALREAGHEAVKGLEESIRLLRKARPQLVVYVDNMESLQIGPKNEDAGAVGAWHEAALPAWRALERLSRELVLLMVSTRYTWPDLDPEAFVAIEPMSKADLRRMIETFKDLRRLPHSVKNRLAEMADGHPRTVERLDQLVRQQRAKLGLGREIKDAWVELIEPIVPTTKEKIREDLLFELLWKRLSEAARSHARALSVLRLPAPMMVVDALGSAESTQELIQTSLLTLFRVHVQDRDGSEWVDRWGIHSIVAELVSSEVDESTRRDAHRRAGLAYVDSVKQGVGVLWSELVEGIFHLHEVDEGAQAWPLVQGYVLHILRRQARYAEARVLLERCEVAGTSGEQLAIALTLLAQMHRSLGECSEEIGALLIRAEGLATSPEIKGSVLHERASLLREQGKYVQAEALLREALAVKKKALGLEYPSYGASLHELARVLLAQSEYAQAEALLREALALKEKTLGLEHPDYGASLHELARVLLEQGEYAQAEALLREALAIDKKALGVKHPDHGASLHVLAGVLLAQGNYTEAEALLREALAIDEKALGVEHPSYGASLHELARVLLEQGEYAQAEALLREALEVKEKALGLEHPSLCPTLTNLAGVLTQQDRADEGEPLIARALRIADKYFGPYHPEIAQILAQFAIILIKLGKPEARDTAQRALEALRLSLGPDHPTTIEVSPVLLRIAAGKIELRARTRARTWQGKQKRRRKRK